MLNYVVDEGAESMTLVPVGRKGFGAWLNTQPPAWGQWVKMAKFKAEAGAVCPVPDEQGQPTTVLVGLGAPRLGSLCSWAMLAKFSNLFLPISTATYSNLRCFSLRIWSC